MSDFKEELKSVYAIGLGKRYERRKKELEFECLRLEGEFRRLAYDAAKNGESECSFHYKTYLEKFAIVELVKKYNLKVKEDALRSEDYLCRILIYGWT